jgi:hypothetical protein
MDLVTPIGVADLTSTTTWSFTYTGMPYADGTRSFYTKAVDAAGNRSDFSAPLNIAFDTTGPAKAQWLHGSYTSNTGTVVVQGYADPGARVFLFVDANSNGVIDTSEPVW